MTLKERNQEAANTHNFKIIEADYGIKFLCIDCGYIFAYSTYSYYDSDAKCTLMTCSEFKLHNALT